MSQSTKVMYNMSATECDGRFTLKMDMVDYEWKWNLGFLGAKLCKRYFADESICPNLTEFSCQIFKCFTRKVYINQIQWLRCLASTVLHDSFSIRQIGPFGIYFVWMELWKIVWCLSYPTDLHLFPKFLC